MQHQQQHRFVRAVLADKIDRLIYLLDMIDGDPDLEDGHDAEAVSEDEGAQCDDEGAIDADREWSLGSLSGEISQGNWAGGAAGDVEADYVEHRNVEAMLRAAAEAARAEAERLGDIIARLSGVPAGSAVRA